MTITASATQTTGTGNGVTTAFTTPQFYDSSSLKVYLNGVLQVSGYTVTGGSGAAGTVTFSVAPAAATSIVIEQAEPFAQTTTYASFQSNPQVTEGRFDRSMLAAQQLWDAARRFPRINVLSGTGAVSIDLSVSRSARHTLTGNVTYSFSNPSPFGIANKFDLLLTQDATGRTVTWPASVKWANGTAPVVTTASRSFLLSFCSPDGGTTWYGVLVGGPYT
jgi:hypothetical protein